MTNIHHLLIGHPCATIHARQLCDLTHDRHTLSSPPQSFTFNSFTGRMPTELGNLDQLTKGMV